MTTSEITTVEQKNQRGNSSTGENLSSSSGQKILFTLKAIEYLLLAAIICSGIIVTLLPDNKNAVIAGAVSLTISIFLLLINKQAFEESRKLNYILLC